MNTKHTPTPWRSIDETIVAQGDQVAGFYGEHTSGVEDMANAARAVACVNACDGIEDPAAALAAARRAIGELLYIYETGDMRDSARNYGERAARGAARLLDMDEA